MRADRIRLHGIIDRISEESAEYRNLMDMARTEDAARFAEIVARIIEMSAAGLCTAEAMRRELGAARMALRAASGFHNPEDLRRIGSSIHSGLRSDWAGFTTPRTCAGSAGWRLRCAGQSP